MTAWLLSVALAESPAELAPGAPELLAAQARLEALLEITRATGSATARLQSAWTTLPAGPGGCADTARLELGWRIERFGAAWREAAQAARAQGERVRRARAAATVAPLVDGRWAAELDGLLARGDTQQRAFLEASAWEAAFVRPTLAACPVVAPTVGPGVTMLESPARSEAGRMVAVLALGDGWVCPGGDPGATDGGPRRAEEAVLLVPGKACWSASPTCGCEPVPVEPGAVIGPEPPPEPVPAPVAPPG